MPQLNEHKAKNLVKCCVIGDSGSGKTGALAALARAGYHLYIVDIDNNLGTLVDVLRQDPKAAELVEYETCADKLKVVNGQVMVDGVPQAYVRVTKLLTDWPGKGPLEKWTDKDVLVIDTLTSLGTAAMRQTLFMNGRPNGPAQLQDWGAAMDAVEKIVQLLATPAVNCHVILNSHINYTESAEGSGVVKGYPMALGNKLSPKVPIYFENVLLLKTQGSGTNRKRVFHTKGDAMIEGKSPVSVAAELPHETGLADFFKALRGGKTP